MQIPGSVPGLLNEFLALGSVLRQVTLVRVTLEQCFEKDVSRRC